MVSPLKTNIDEYTNSVGRYLTGGINELFITIDFMRPRWGILLHTMKTYCIYTFRIRMYTARHYKIDFKIYVSKKILI